MSFIQLSAATECVHSAEIYSIFDEWARQITPVSMHVRDTQKQNQAKKANIQNRNNNYNKINEYEIYVFILIRFRKPPKKNCV